MVKPQTSDVSLPLRLQKCKVGEGITMTQSIHRPYFAVVIATLRSQYTRLTLHTVSIKLKYATIKTKHSSRSC